MADEQISREDEFAKVIGEAREQGMFGGKEEAPEVEAKPEKTEDVSRGTGRDQNGRFVPKEPTEEKEPFAGFKDLPDAVKAEFSKLSGHAKRLESEQAQLRRQNGALMGRVPQLQSEVARLQRSGQQAPSADKTADLTAQLKRFKEYKERFPEDAEAIEEYVQATRNELAETKRQLADQFSQLKSDVDSFKTERQVQENNSVQDALDRDHPEWRIIAGWADADGNPVPDGPQRQFHPHFEAWRNALPPELRNDYQQKLGTRSATLIGHVFDHFKRDYQVALEASQGKTAEPVARNQRQEALRDVSPTGRAGSAVVDRSQMTPQDSREAEFAATIAKFRGDPRFAHLGLG